jgi:hypothetical protein
MAAASADPGSRTAAAGKPVGLSGPVKAVMVNSNSYYAGNLTYAAAVFQSDYVTLAARLIRACPAAGSWGFVSRTSPIRAGVVVWLPKNPLDCVRLPVSGGGPGAGGSEPCVQLFQTFNRQSFVLIVGSDATICADLSTEVPSGEPARIYNSTAALAAGQSVLVKCQAYNSQGVLYDRVVLLTYGAAALPFTRAAWYVRDDNVVTNYKAIIPNVPRCWGFTNQL